MVNGEFADDDGSRGLVPALEDDLVEEVMKSMDKWASVVLEEGESLVCLLDTGLD